MPTLEEFIRIYKLYDLSPEEQQYVYNKAEEFTDTYDGS